MKIFHPWGYSVPPDPVRNPGGTELEVDKWAVSEFLLRRIVPRVGTHPFPLDELVLMTAALIGFRPSHVFEWGTHFGKSARIFHEISKTFGLAVEIHSIDLPDAVDHCEHPGGKRGKLVRRIPSIHLHQGDGLDTSLAICRELGSRIRLPLFFLDGDHRYESVKREMDGIRATAPTAVMLVHDTFYQSAGSGYNTGPHRAIEDMMELAAGEYSRISTTLGLPGMTLLFRKDTARETADLHRIP